MVALGKFDEARRNTEQLLAVAPNMTVSIMRLSLPFRRAKDMDFVLDALRIAGMPE